MACKSFRSNLFVNILEKTNSYKYFDNKNIDLKKFKSKT